MTTEPLPDPSADTGPGPFGDPRVAAALAQLDVLADQPTSEHVAMFDDVHRQLQDCLADLDGR